MNYKEARVYLDQIAKYGSVLGLENIRALNSELNNPQDGLKFVHIAGTNGKGSTLAFISTILSTAGYKVGRYISPTIFSYRERIQVGEEPISKEDLADGITLIHEAIGRMEAAGLSSPTVFEVETALSFWYFRKQQCDIVVLEAGLGGSMDATNVITGTEAAVFTSVSRDHMTFLGDTLDEIAVNKAGIIKEGCDVISVLQDEAAGAVLRKRAADKGCPYITADVNNASVQNMVLEKTVFSYRDMDRLSIHLPGCFQVENAVLAIETVMALRRRGFSVEENHIREGLNRTVWQGRLCPIGSRPLFLVDGAHNVGAARRLKESVETYFRGRRLIFIIGVFADKEYPQILKIMAPLAAKIITVSTPDNDRALPAEMLKKEALEYCPDTEAAESLRDAAERAVKAAGSEDVILAFGSLSYLGEMTGIVKKIYLSDKGEGEND